MPARGNQPKYRTDAIVFDLDGTLIDSVPDVRNALNRTLASDGRRPLSHDEVCTMVGEGARVMFEKAWAATGDALTGEAFEVLFDRYAGYYLAHPADETVIYPGVSDILEALAGDGVALGICTNKPQALSVAVLEALGLRGLFASIVGGDATQYRKPDARHVFETLAPMGAETAAAAFVGDSAIDVAAARNAGLPIVLVSWGYRHVPAADLGADAVIDRFADLPTALAGLTAQPDAADRLAASQVSAPR